MFPDELRLINGGMRGGSRLFVLEAPFRTVSSYGTVTTPAGTVTDGASIPRAFWPLLQPFGPYFEAAIAHDDIYNRPHPSWSRREADLIFLEAMSVLGVGVIARQTIFRSVRLFGGHAYKGGAK